MRCYQEAVEVVEGREGPERFRWRGRLLLVKEVLSRWVETGAWWDTPLVRAVRGDDDSVTERGRTTDRGRSPEGRGDEVDLLAEHELWRVVARPAATAADEAGGVYELDRSCGTGAWRLRAVVD